MPLLYESLKIIDNGTARVHMAQLLKFKAPAMNTIWAMGFIRINIQQNSANFVGAKVNIIKMVIRPVNINVVVRRTRKLVVEILIKHLSFIFRLVTKCIISM